MKENLTSHDDISSKPRKRVLGVDIGTHRIGVAVSDELLLIASPETTVAVAQSPQGRAQAINEIRTLVQRFGAGRVVAGLPRNMRGEQGVQAEWTMEFVVALREALNPEGVYIVLFDERLTSAQAGRSFRADDRSFDQAMPSADWRRQAEDTQRANDRLSRRKPIKKEGRQTVDARAAALILQGYLDRHRHRDDIDDGARES